MAGTPMRPVRPVRRSSLLGAALCSVLTIAGCSKNEAPPAALEAALERGGIIRMHLRCEITGPGGDGPRWLIHIEDLGAQQTLRDAEEFARPP